MNDEADRPDGTSGADGLRDRTPESDAGRAPAGGNEHAEAPAGGERADTSAGTTEGPTSHRGTGRRKGGKSSKGARRGSFWRELPVLLVVAFVLAILLKTFLIQAFFIPSASMEKTLHGCPGCSGDRVLVNKLVYRFHDPRPGDVVVFRGPNTWQPEVHVSEPSNPVSKFFRAIAQAVGAAQPSEKDFVKRVIAVGGQTVSCCDAKGRVQVDGRSLDEPYIYQNSPQVNSTTCGLGRKFGPVTVPKGRLWVMGDHRSDSADSRCHVDDQYHGTVAVDEVIGKAFLRVWPPSRWGTLGTPSTFKDDDSMAGMPVPTPLLLGTVAVTPVGAWRWRRYRRPGRRARR